MEAVIPKINIPILDSEFIADKDIAEMLVTADDKGNGVYFSVARMRNPRHEKASRKYAADMDRTRKAPKLQNEILAKIVAESILMSWRGLKDKEGNEIEPTYENRLSVLMSYPDLMNAVMVFANTISNYQDVVVDEETKEEIIIDEADADKESMGNLKTV